MSDERDAADMTVVHAASWQGDRGAIERIRRAVFIEEQGIPEADEWDDTDPVSLHVLAGATKRDAVGTGDWSRTVRSGASPCCRSTAARRSAAGSWAIS